MKKLILLLVTTSLYGQVAVIKTLNAPSWGTVLPMRAGFTNTLDGTSSTGSSLTYFWQCLSYDNGVSVTSCDFLKWSSHTSSQPTLINLIFGDYLIQLCVTSSGTKNCATSHIGAVSYDGNGVVLVPDRFGDGREKKLLGPMIAVGQNPWGYVDRQTVIVATPGRYQNYVNNGFLDTLWRHPTTGTIAWVGSGVNTTLNGSCSNTATSCVVTSASTLGITVFPSLVAIGPYPNPEIVDVCSVTSNTLNFCYDGRGWVAGRADLASTYAVPTSWTSGVAVDYGSVIGTGTTFSSSVCPDGYQGGAIIYNTGTIQITHNSTAVVGSGTTFTSDMVGKAITIHATHSATPFVALRRIGAFTDATHITLDRAILTDTDDASGLTYDIVKDDYGFSLQYTRSADSSLGRHYESLIGCLSNTSAFHFPQYDNPDTNPSHSGLGYEAAQNVNLPGQFGVNFYDEIKANYTVWYSSGTRLALTSARMIANEMASNPIYGTGNTGSPLDNHITGAFLGAIIDNQNGGYSARQTDWTDLRMWARSSISLFGSACSHWDTRDGHLIENYPGLLASYDPDPTSKATWADHIKTNALARDEACDQSGTGPFGSVLTNSHAHGFNNSIFSTQVTLQNGTKSVVAVSGSPFNATTCGNVQASGVAHVINGDYHVTYVSGNNFTVSTTTSKIGLLGAISGTEYLGRLGYTQVDGTHVNIAGLWPGATADVPYQIEADENSLTFNTNDPDSDIAEISKSYLCGFVDGSHITLMNNFQGCPNGSPCIRNITRFNIPGFGISPYMGGAIMTNQFQFVKNTTSDSDVATRYNTQAVNFAKWFKGNAYDTTNNITYYGNIFENCEPKLTPSPVNSQAVAGGNFSSSVVSGCQQFPNQGGLLTARGYNGESMPILRPLYEDDPSSANKTFGDNMYGYTFGKTGYQISSPCGTVPDGDNTPADSFSDIWIGTGGYKYWGGFCGLGNCREWPAVRCGGPTTAVPLTLNVTFNKGTADHVVVTLLKPDSTPVTASCSSSPCAVIGDYIQNVHLMRLQYYTAGNALLSDSGYTAISLQ